MAMTDKQAAFVREYLIDLNATQAAIRAGYSEKTARAIGHENLGKHYFHQLAEIGRLYLELCCPEGQALAFQVGVLG